MFKNFHQMIQTTNYRIQSSISWTTTVRDSVITFHEKSQVRVELAKFPLTQTQFHRLPASISSGMLDRPFC